MSLHFHTGGTVSTPISASLNMKKPHAPIKICWICSRCSDSTVSRQQHF